MNIVILAAGMGKRMRSAMPKVLHPLAGRALLQHVLTTARSLNPGRIVIVFGHGGDQVQAALPDQDLRWALQSPQLGTGHAVMQALDQLAEDQPTLVLYGDVPLTRASTLQRLIAAAGDDKLAVLTVDLPDPSGYGRIVREQLSRDGAITAIVEHKDASPEIRAVTEVNTGIMVIPPHVLRPWLQALSNNNAQGEYYLTDVVARAVQEGVAVVSAQPDVVHETLGVNSKVQLAELERLHQRELADHLLEDGVTLLDPARIDIRGTLRCAQDVTIDVGCVFEGEVQIGANAVIGPYCVIRNAVIGAGTELAAYSHIDGASTGADCKIGPYARLRPGTELGAECHVGNFVELKNSQFDQGSKANHLAYVGDATVGQRVNIGAGTITCNYDGANKHRTVIEDDVHVGSDTQLVAPVRVGARATIAAGTTVWQDVPSDGLALNGKSQSHRSTWVRPKKKQSA